jgi:hypothetical protein
LIFAPSGIEPLHRSRRPLLLHARGGWSGRQGTAHSGRAGVAALGNRAHPGLFAGSARAQRADVRHAAGPTNARLAANCDGGVPAGRDDRDVTRREYLVAGDAKLPAAKSMPFGRMNWPGLGTSAISTTPLPCSAASSCSAIKGRSSCWRLDTAAMVPHPRRRRP